MGSSLRLFWAGLSVLALGVASCSSTTVPLGVDGGGGAGGPTDGPKTDGAKTDGATTDGAKSDAMDARGPDLNVPPPAMLTATVLDRRATTFELLWTAPSAGGAAVSGYQVRYAKVPITATNFDDATMTTTVPYTGTPKAPGETDGMIVKAYIENGYYFAVIGTDSGGTNVGTLMATTAAVAAHFNVTTLAGTSGLANEQFGIQLDGSGDVNGDGHSDLLVGSTAGQRAYLFFGTNGTFSPSAPAVVFSGDATTTAFGYGVAQIGDIDKDGHEDIAISDISSSPPRVFIYKGRVTWPMTMTPTTADYVITADASYAGSVFGISMARLGDFNGDGTDDFAIGASQYTNGSFGVGRVVVILGKAGFGAITLPDITNAITIDGDASLGFPLFGFRVMGLGHFYSAATHTTLVVSEPGIATSTSGQGHLYAFHGQTGSGGAIALASADNMLIGPALGADIGSVLANLGPILTALPAVGSGNPSDTVTNSGISGSAYLLSGDATSGPFATRTALTQTGVSKSGQVVIGGGISGRDASYSLLGDARPDLVLVPQTGSSIQIIDGNRISGLGAGPTDTATVVTATITLPSGWLNTGQGEGQLIPDINGDGYPDFALANAINPVPGAVAVYW